jgi:hypothetical protein
MNNSLRRRLIRRQSNCMALLSRTSAVERLNKHQRLPGTAGEFFLGEELEGAIAFHIYRIPKIAIGSRKDRDDDAVLMTVGRLFNPFAHYKL